MLTPDRRLPAEAVLTHPAFCRLGISVKDLIEAVALVDPRVVEVDSEAFTLVPKLEGIRNTLMLRDVRCSADELRQHVLSAPCLEEQRVHEERRESLSPPWMACRPSWQKLLSIWADGDLWYVELADEDTALEVALHLQGRHDQTFKVKNKLRLDAGCC